MPGIVVDWQLQPFFHYMLSPSTISWLVNSESLLFWKSGNSLDVIQLIFNRSWSHSHPEWPRSTPSHVTVFYLLPIKIDVYCQKIYIIFYWVHQVTIWSHKQFWVALKYISTPRVPKLETIFCKGNSTWTNFWNQNTKTKLYAWKMKLVPKPHRQNGFYITFQSWRQWETQPSKLTK